MELVAGDRHLGCKGVDEDAMAHYAEFIQKD
jgi:hypothetical protein